jgi:aspartate/methionine/tyrosine aminotransferase
MINFLAQKAVPIIAREHFRLDVNELKSLINDRTKLIILNSPQNPTGGADQRRSRHRCADAIAHHGAER